MKTLAFAGLVAGAFLASAVWAQPAIEPPPLSAPAAPPSVTDMPAAAALVASLPPPLAELAAEVLARNPDLARARREAVAAALRAPQVSALPDPMATLTPFLASPETRVGPQLLAAGISQRVPWFGKLALREQAALYAAAAARAEAEGRAVALVTETRRLYYDLAFLAAQEAAVRADRTTLEHYEEVARARYSSGVGLEQAVVKLQAEITRDDNRLLDIAVRRAALLASLDALRDREQGSSLPAVALPREPPRPQLIFDVLEELALATRPEVARARSRLAEMATMVELAKKDYFPDVTVGLNYTVVGRRDDAAGRAMPPEGNGDDVVGLLAGVNLPVWRRRLDAAVEEASERELAAQEGLRSVANEIARALGDLVHRIPLTAAQYELLDGVLTIQAEEALRSAETAYGAGALGALDLLDAERVLLEVRVAAARTLADLAIAVARLEGAVARPIAPAAAPSTDHEPDAEGNPAAFRSRSDAVAGGDLP
jgi:outer membrane protein, heavy metal efflux system